MTTRPRRGNISSAFRFIQNRFRAEGFESCCEAVAQLGVVQGFEIAMDDGTRGMITINSLFLSEAAPRLVIVSRQTSVT